MNNTNDSTNVYKKTGLYELDNNIILHYYPQRIMDIIGVEYHSLLDCGIGHGYSAATFNKYFSRHVVLDADIKLIQNFQNKHPECNIEFINTYFEHYNSNEKFDVIVLGFVLEHVDNPVEILIKYKQFLSKNGRMFLIVPNSDALNRRIGNLAGLLENLSELSDFDRDAGHKRFYNVASLTQDCKSAGLTIKNIEGIFLKALTTTQLTSLNLDDDILKAFCIIGKDYPELSCGIMAEIKER